MRPLYRLLAFVLGCVLLASSSFADAPQKRELVLQAPPATSVDSVAVSPGGSLVATAAGEGGVRLYDAKTGALLRTIGAAGDRGVRFSPDGRTLSAAGFHMDKLVGVFDVQTGRRVLALAGHTEWEAYAAAVSPDGKLLASTGTDKQILVWELATGKLRHQIKDLIFPISALAFSPDSTTLASGGGDKLVRLWDCATGELRQSLSGHGEWICSLAFAPDGRPMALSLDGSILATGGKSVQLWDVRTGQKLRQLSGHLKRTQSIAFSADGKLLVAGGSYGTTNLWDVATGRHLVTLFAFSETKSGAATDDWLAYHPDGCYECSPGGERYLAWRVGDELQTATAIGPQFHRPERITAALRLTQ